MRRRQLRVSVAPADRAGGDRRWRMALVNGATAWLYPYGLLGVDVARVILIATAVMRSGLRGRAGCSLRRRCGGWADLVRGLPLALSAVPVADEDSTGLSGAPLLALRRRHAGGQHASYVVIEQPIRQRRRPAWLVRVLAPLAAGGPVASVLLARRPRAAAGVPRRRDDAEASAQAHGQRPRCTVRSPTPRATAWRRCRVSRRPSSCTGARRPQAAAGADRARRPFHTCPPKRVLVVGDSLAFTLGRAEARETSRATGQLANAGDARLRVHDPRAARTSAATGRASRPGCPNALQTWAAREAALHPQAVIVELGYRDEFDWKIERHVVHLGQPAFDAYVQRQIDHSSQVLGRRRHQDPVPVGALTPIRRPCPTARRPRPPRRPGTPRSTRCSRPPPAGIRTTVQVLDIDQTVSPGDHYTAEGQRASCAGSTASTSALLRRAARAASARRGTIA